MELLLLLAIYALIISLFLKLVDAVFANESTKIKLPFEDLLKDFAKIRTPWRVVDIEYEGAEHCCIATNGPFKVMYTVVTTYPRDEEISIYVNGRMYLYFNLYHYATVKVYEVNQTPLRQYVHLGNFEHSQMLALVRFVRHFAGFFFILDALRKHK